MGRFASVYNDRMLWLPQKLHKRGQLFVFPEIPPLLLIGVSRESKPHGEDR